MLEAKNLSVELGGKPVLRDVSAALEPGKITAICGPNGAGKSTLLSALAGLIPAASGEVQLDGRMLPETSAKDRARAIGYLPQSGELAWDVSVETLAGLGRLPHGDAGTEHIAAALKALDLSSFAKRPVSTLSGGEKARALLARVLVGQPDWILADEPLAALDPAHQLAMLAHLRKCAAAGAGVVLVLHDLALAMNYADNVLVLEQGQVRGFASPDQALSSEVIVNVWGISARWTGKKGEMAVFYYPNTCPTA